MRAESSNRSRHLRRRAWHPHKAIRHLAGGPSSQAVPIRSTGTKPGDVAEEGKLFERVSFERFDKSPQS